MSTVLAVLATLAVLVGVALGRQGTPTARATCIEHGDICYVIGTAEPTGPPPTGARAPLGTVPPAEPLPTPGH